MRYTLALQESVLPELFLDPCPKALFLFTPPFILAGCSKSWTSACKSSLVAWAGHALVEVAPTHRHSALVQHKTLQGRDLALLKDSEDDNLSLPGRKFHRFCWPGFSVFINCSATAGEPVLLRSLRLMRMSEAFKALQTLTLAHQSEPCSFELRMAWSLNKSFKACYLYTNPYVHLQHGPSRLNGECISCACCPCAQ